VDQYDNLYNAPSSGLTTAIHAPLPDPGHSLSTSFPSLFGASLRASICLHQWPHYQHPCTFPCAQSLCFYLFSCTSVYLCLFSCTSVYLFLFSCSVRLCLPMFLCASMCPSSYYLYAFGVLTKHSHATSLTFKNQSGGGNPNIVLDCDTGYNLTLVTPS
jgi:hypothetical protein